MRAAAPWGVLVALTAPAPAWALGLGDIELHSALNQPFRAEIGLTATNEELESLRVALASREVFESSGLDRPAFLSSFQFTVAPNAAGRNVISVTSRGSVAEPFVTLIVQATWASGTLQREYTVFLDPPVLLPRSQAPITAPRTGVSETPRPAAPIARDPAPQAQPAVQPRPEPPAPAPSPAPRAVPPASTSGVSEGSYGPVRPAETLWAIAERHQPADATMNQTMVAIYDANPEAFGGNINVLRAGAILRIPGRDEFLARTAAAATAEVQRQTEAWQQSRGQPDRLVLVPPSPDSVGAGAGSQQPAATSTQSRGEVARLESEVASLRAELDESRRLLEVRNQELADLQEQLAADRTTAPTPRSTDPSVTTAPGVDIDNTQIFADDPAEDAEPVPVADAPEVEPPAATTTTERPPAVVTTRREEPSLVSQIIGWITSGIGLAVAGVVAILFGALWFMRRRRDEEVDDVTGQWDALQAGMEETKVPRAIEPRISVPSSRVDADDDIFGASSPFVVEERPTSSSTTLPIDDADEIAADHYAQSSTTKPSIDDTMSASAVLNLDEADPVAEADFHMAYGLYDQAAELLSKELRENPNRRDLQLKLLEVYFVWGNKDEFLDAAQHLRKQMGAKVDADWDKVLIMGKQICPDAELFAKGAAGAPGAVDLSFGEVEDDDQALDFALDESADAVDLDIGEATSLDLSGDDDALDLDLTGNHPRFVDETGTLDIGVDTAAGLEQALSDDTVEDVSADAETVAVPKGMDPEMLIATQETPHLADSDSEDLWADFSIDESALDSPTIEQVGAEQPTVESPMLSETQRQRTAVITDDAVDEDRTTEMPTIGREGPAAIGTEKTAEIELNDLGLEISDIDDPLGLSDIAAELDSEAGDTQQQRALEDAELLSATGITQVLQQETGRNKTDTSEQTKLQAGATMLGRAELDRRAAADTELLEKPDDEFDLDLDDLSAALSDAETVEQRRSTDFDFGLSGPTTPVDLDVGETFIGDDDPTGTDDQRGIDPQTLTEVGTKLDLARAYIDMGDPDGARSILDEVISEGDKRQREEAQSLIDALGV